MSEKITRDLNRWWNVRHKTQTFTINTWQKIDFSGRSSGKSTTLHTNVNTTLQCLEKRYMMMLKS